MFRELFYVGMGLILFAGIIFLFRTFDTSPGSSLTGFAVREGQQTTPLTEKTIVGQPQMVQQNITDNTPTVQESQSGGASAQFQVAVQVVG
ncbi:MAG: hypothetical protein Q8L34_05795 [Candidatus Woesearchaeota archaeon]|nr:hypothetical protein [Candidatus Woesearchaeota archaeon]